VVALAAVGLLRAFSADAGLWQTDIATEQVHLVRLPVLQLLVRICSTELVPKKL